MMKYLYKSMLIWQVGRYQVKRASRLDTFTRCRRPFY